MTEQSGVSRALRQVPQQDESADLRVELTQAQEEVLRLRDLLIGKEAELGAVRGRLAELEAGAAPLVLIAARLRALLPASLRALASRLLGRG